MSGWLEETLHRDFRIGLKIDRLIYDKKTDHQHLVLFENDMFGLVMALDGVIQMTENDEYIYHEMLTHVPILAHGAVRNVLIVGGGDGGSLEEVLKHRSVEAVTMVELDPAVIDLSRTYLRPICGDAFDDPRFQLVIADGMDYVTNCADRYDTIIIDSTDPLGPGEVLFSSAFYAGCKQCLAPGGVLVTQNGVPFLQGAELTRSLAALKPLFADTSCYLATVPTYVGGPMAFGWATENTALRRTSLAVLQRRFDRAAIETRYYTPAVHGGAFIVPRYVAELFP